MFARLRSIGSWVLLLIVLAIALPVSAARAAPMARQKSPKAIQPVSNACPRLSQWGQVAPPPALYSQNGALSVSFSFQTRTDPQGRTLYCFMTPDGLENPTLHVLPGDKLYITVTNNTPQSILPPMVLNPQNCGAAFMYPSSVNIHYHGTNTAPVCGGDEVIKTIINSGKTFQYTLNFPADEPPGLYWYHPHVHGTSDAKVIGGATGVLVVDGIEKFFPQLNGMPQQTIVLRDQQQYQNRGEGSGNCGIAVPFRDITVNDVPVNSYQMSEKVVLFTPANLTTTAGQTQFWRVANTSADSITDLSLVYDGVPQPLSLVAIDGVPVNSQDGTGQGTTIPVNHFRLPPASRVEFIATMPTTTVKLARLMTQNINTGPAGDCDPTRPLITIKAQTPVTAKLLASVPARPISDDAGRRFAGLKNAPVTATRTIYFSEDGEKFYITVNGQTPHQFDPNDPPSIQTTQNAVEQWTIQNQSKENHEFHIHQIHFLVQSQDNFGPEPTAPGIDNQFLDTVEVPAWSGNKKDPFPSVTLLMDFRGAVVGSFVFHCHILNHEDQGMMSIIQVFPAGYVIPAKAAAKTETSPPSMSGMHHGAM